MKAISLTVIDIFNMSFGQVFVAGIVEGQDELVRPSQWKLLVNGKEVAELKAIGEQLPKGNIPNQRIISYQGSIDTTQFDVKRDEVILLKVE